MINDGCNEGGIYPVDEIIHMVCYPHGILYLFIWSISLFKCGTLRVTVPLDWSPLALFSAPSFPEFWPRSPPCYWRYLLTSLVNFWFCCVSSAITTVMDCSCCWTVMGGWGAWFGWLEVFPPSWCPGLVAIDLVQTMLPFCLGKRRS